MYHPILVFFLVRERQENDENAMSVAILESKMVTSGWVKSELEKRAENAYESVQYYVNLYEGLRFYDITKNYGYSN